MKTPNTRHKTRSRLIATLLTGACALSIGSGSAAFAQTENPIQDRLSPGNVGEGPNALERGINEAVRGGLQGQSVRDAVRRGVGEAAQSSVETPDQTLQRDRLRRDQELYDQRRAYQGDLQSRRVLSQDAQGRNFYLDNQGRRVYVQPQGQAYGAADVQTEGYWSGQGQPVPDRAQLGVAIENAAQGVRVVGVGDQTAAAEAGLQPGDVITQVDGQQVNNAQSLSQMIRTMEANQQVDLVVQRNGQEQSITATLEAAGDQRRMAKPAVSGSNQNVQQLQSEVEDLRRQLDQLRQEISQLKSAGGADANAAANADQGEPNAQSNQAGNDELLDAGGEVDAEVETDTEASLETTSPANAGDAGADAEAATEADAELQQ